MRLNRAFLALALALVIAGATQGRGAPAPANGFIQIVGEPGIQVFLDDTLQGVTTKEDGGIVLSNIPAGTHTIKAVKEGFEPQKFTGSIKPGEVRVIQLKGFAPIAKSSNLSSGNETPGAGAGGNYSPRPTRPAGGKISVAVYPIKASGATDKANASALTSLLGYELTQSEKLIVIKEDMLNEVMKRQAMNQSDMCDSTTCQVEIGKLVAAQKMVSGELIKMGSRYLMTISLVDIQSGAQEFSAKEQCACSDDQLDQLVAVAGAKIRNYFGEAIAVPRLPDAAPTSAQSGAVAETTRAGQRSGPGAYQTQTSPAVGGASPDKAMLYTLFKTAGSGAAFFCQQMGSKIPILMDGQVLGSVGCNQCLKRAVEPGRHIISDIMKGAAMGGAGDFVFDTVPGGSYFLVENLTMGLRIKTDFSLVSELEAARWAQNCVVAPQENIPARPLYK